VNQHLYSHYTVFWPVPVAFGQDTNWKWAKTDFAVQLSYLFPVWRKISLLLINLLLEWPSVLHKVWHHCCIWWGRYQSGPDSSADWLLH